MLLATGLLTPQKLINDATNMMGLFTNRGRDIYNATDGGKVEDLQALLVRCSPADVNWQKADGRTSLYIAARAGRKDIVKLLLQKAAETNLATKHGYTPLFVAAENGHRQVVKLLLAGGAFINQAAQTGTTALYIAAQEGHKAIARLLLDQGADMNHAILVHGVPTAVEVDGPWHYLGLHTDRISGDTRFRNWLLESLFGYRVVSIAVQFIQQYDSDKSRAAFIQRTVALPSERRH